MQYVLDEINQKAIEAPGGFIHSAENAYNRQIQRVADEIVANMHSRPIVLLNGPSSSGKTTTARLLGQSLKRRGVHAELISMDDYYRTRSEYIMPKDETGTDDLESPECMDLPLLSEQLHRLVQGEEIAVPRYNFEQQRRTEEVERLTLDPNEVAIIEGIHSFNDILTGSLKNEAIGLYLSVASSVDCGDNMVLEPEMLRFARRAIRDSNFRGSPIEATIRQWRSIRRGETLYIAPYRNYATLSIDSYLPYEDCILMPMLAEKILAYREQMEAANLGPVCDAAARFHIIDHEPFFPVNSLLHEFIG